MKTNTIFCGQKWKSEAEWSHLNHPVQYLSIAGTPCMILNVHTHTVQEVDSQLCLASGRKEKQKMSKRKKEERRQCSNITAVSHSGFAPSWKYLGSVCVEIQWNIVYYRLPNEGCTLKSLAFSALVPHHEHELADGFQGPSSEKDAANKMKEKSAF